MKRVKIEKYNKEKKKSGLEEIQGGEGCTEIRLLGKCAVYSIRSVENRQADCACDIYRLFL